MKNSTYDSKSARHNLSDWLDLHGLDRSTCAQILVALTSEALSEPAAVSSRPACHIDFEAAGVRTVEAMRNFFPGQRSFVEDTFANTTKIVVDQGDKPRKALTLDNGAGAYPTIVLTYRNKPVDALVLAHEFAHALQIRACGSKFVPPLIRETCAFLGEAALLSDTLRNQDTQHAHLVQAWRNANRRHFGAHRDRLEAALLSSDVPYEYSWNYPIARYLAIRMSERCSSEWNWRVFQGKYSVAEIIEELGIAGHSMRW